MKDKMEKMQKDWAKSPDQFPQKFDQKPLNYLERQDKMQKKESSQLKKQKYVGRYE